MFDAGVSVVKTDPDNKVLCFTTSHRGVFLESYHLKLQRLASGHFKVVHHDLPPFLVHSTLPDYLQVKDVISAVRPLQEALSMFVMRREELKGVQVRIRGIVRMVNFLCTSVQISACGKCDSTIVLSGNEISVQVCDFYFYLCIYSFILWFLLVNWAVDMFLIPSLYSRRWAYFDTSVSPWDSRTCWLDSKHWLYN